MSEEKLELHADYTDREKAKQAKKEKKSLSAKKAAETRKRKKEQRQKEEDAVFWKQQDEKGYKNLFGENNNKINKNETKNMSKKNTIRLTESDLKRIISESVKKILRENQYYEDMIQQIDINELIEMGNTCYEDLDIYRVSKKEDGILEIVIYNNSNGNEGRARIGLTGDIEEDYYYAIQKALDSMM